MDKNQLKKILIKANDLLKGKEVAVAKSFLEVEDKIDTTVKSIDEQLEQIIKDVTTPVNQSITFKDTEVITIRGKDGKDGKDGIDGIDGKNGVDGKDGKDGRDGIDGKDYVLTDNDKKEIIQKIEVPIVEKVIEKTEVIREKPIVTNNITKVENKETAETLVKKINSGKSLIKKEKIEGFSDLERMTKESSYKVFGGGGVSEARVREIIGSSSGGTDHALLSNLDYASSGHTGFAPALGADDNYVTDAEKVKLSNLSGTNTGDQTTISGNAGTATTLQNTRTIWGQNFNGSANVTGTLALGASDLTLTGSIGATGARATKVWTAALESTAMPTVGGTAIINDTAYGVGWNGSTAVAPSQNAVYDQVELKAPIASPTFTGTVSVPLGGITGHSKIIYKTADETVNNSSTLQNDDHLLFSVGANEVWAVQLFILYDSGTIPDIKFQWSLPASATAFMPSMPYYDANYLDGTTAQNINGLGAGTTAGVLYSGVITISSTAGNVVLQWAQNTTNLSDTKVLKGSYIIAHRLV